MDAHEYALILYGHVPRKSERRKLNADGNEADLGFVLHSVSQNVRSVSNRLRFVVVVVLLLNCNFQQTQRLRKLF